MALIIVLGLLSAWFCFAAAVGTVLAATWSSEMQVNRDDSSPDWNPMVVCDSAGTAWVFWMGIDPAQGDFELYCSRWTGSGWTAEERIHSDNLQKDAWPVACIGRDGIPWVMWERAREGGSFAWDLLTAHWTGDGWSEPETMLIGGGEGQLYDIACVDSSLVWIAVDVYVRREDLTYDTDIHFRKREGGVWGSLEKIDRPGVDDRYPSIAISPQGVPWVVWGGGTILASYRNSLGWSEPVLSRRQSYGFICFSGGEGPWILFLSGLTISSTFWDGQNWMDSGPIPSPHAIETEWDYRPSMSGLAVGGPLIVWPRADHGNVWRGDVYLSRWADCWWKTESLVTEPDSELVAVDGWPDVSVGASGRTWVVWERCDFPDCADTEIWARYSDDVIYEPWVRSFTGRSEGSSVALEWQSPDSIGFEVYRSDMGECGRRASHGQRELLTPVPLRGQRSFVDSSAQPGRRYSYWLEVVSDRGLCEEHGPVLLRLCAGAVRAGLVGVRPNPSGTGFMIGYYSGDEARGEIEVFDLSGRPVRRLECDAVEGETPWDGRDNSGKEVRPGVYFVRLLVGGRELGGAIKVVLLR